MGKATLREIRQDFNKFVLDDAKVVIDDLHQAWCAFLTELRTEGAITARQLRRWVGMG